MNTTPRPKTNQVGTGHILYGLGCIVGILSVSFLQRASGTPDRSHRQKARRAAFIEQTNADWAMFRKEISREQTDRMV